MAETREVYRVGENGSSTYAGYASFNRNGEYQGTRGGYGPSGRGNSTAFGRTNVGNARSNSASRVQNYIQTAGIRGRNRGR